MIRVFLVFLVGLCSAWGEGYEFRYEGKPIEPGIDVVFGEPGEPAEGDVAWVRGFRIVLGKPGIHEFRQEGEGLLVGKLPGDPEERPIAVRVDTSYEGDEPQLVDPLATMPAEQKRLLRGVMLEELPKDVSASLDGIDWSHAVLVVSQEFAESDGETLRALPDGVRYFELNLSRTPSIENVAALTAAKDLVWLELDSGFELDLRSLAGLRELRSLGLRWASVKGTDSLASLAQLRELDLYNVDAIDDLGFASSLTELRKVGIAKTPVTDLQPLAGLSKLREIDADFTQIETLPDAPEWGALRRLSMLSTPVEAEDVEVLKSIAPDAQILVSWHEALMRHIDGSDRLRVRSGGTCHRDPSTEETLFEITGEDEIRELFEKLEIDDSDSGFHCMCCGEPSLELYRGDVLVATLGFHHGRSLRWSEGWPGDALLTEEAGDTICKFLAEHGVSEPLQELEEKKAREGAARRLWKAYLELASEAFFEALSADDAETAEVIEKEWPDADERAARLFALYGVRVTGAWRLSAGYDSLLQEGLLGELEARAVLDLVAREDLPAEVMQGLTRWFLFDRESEEVRGKLDDEAIRKLGEWGLRHPLADNREEALYGLASMKHPEATRLLTEFLEGRLEARDEEVAGDPGGSVTYRPHGDPAPDGADLEGVAAWLLMGLDPASARPLIEKRLKSVEGEQAKVLKLALER